MLVYTEVEKVKGGLYGSEWKEHGFEVRQTGFDRQTPAPSLISCLI